MNLEEIKKYDDSMWLHVLKIRTVFDTEKIKAHKDWLIKTADESKELKETIYSIIQLSHLDRADNAYEKAIKRIENLIIYSWGKQKN